ncbi:hypothetical protein Tdes44962_MAKER10248 [Teratosphaeria destructans]|uniref:DUF7624 domain-containing protein n=1 Tax=Teratosphaeria destructans TaxID=418781 RepID=A0A9W7SMF1_9PEZI|nr:hypothetical protein Tdes44962_MAKER10248 [Teratosphaeria destructans]
MALKSPLMPSPTGAGVSSAFSPYTDSPSSPPPYHHTLPGSSSNRTSDPSTSLAPPPSPYPQQIEPSPVDSNGTENTDIDEEAQDDSGVKSPGTDGDGELVSPDIDITSPASVTSPQSADRPQKINTLLPARERSDSTQDEPQSVIHAPSGFREFEGGKPDQTSPTTVSESSGKVTVVSPNTPEPAPSQSPTDKKLVSPVDTDVPRIMDRSTPRAQSRQDLEDEWKRRSKRASTLEDVPEGKDEDDDAAGPFGENSVSQAMQQSLQEAAAEVAALQTALSECWTLCNTLAALSSSHRQRTFKFAGKQDIQEQAWRSCWRMCQQLYDHRAEDHAEQVIPTLELCRDFCQSLFDARQKGDEASDAVLRVSFELSNHLYNTHDRALPEAFNERTLDFYITMCHRLMKQRTSLPHETDALLRACWNLAEMLFNLRQSTKEGRSPDEELLGSAVQACWELCDLFREGWTQIRPERGTPRPSQPTFSTSLNTSQSSYGSRQTPEARSSSSLSNRQYHDAQTDTGVGTVPETPTTIFDDMTSAASSPDTVNVPNILVLGPASKNGGAVRGGGAPHHERWSSNASILSGYSDSASSQRTSSTATASSDDAHLARLRYLLLKAATHTGYKRHSGESLPSFVKSLPVTAFGTLLWQKKVLELYKKLVVSDKSMLNIHGLPSRRLGASEVAKSVKWLGSSEQWAWMRDLYRLVFGFGIDEAERRGGGFTV